MDNRKESEKRTRTRVIERELGGDKKRMKFEGLDSERGRGRESERPSGDVEGLEA